MSSAAEIAAQASANVIPAARVLDVAEGYERWAAEYDRFPNPLLAREERYVIPLLPDLRGKHALDFACGTGRWLEKLTSRTHHAVGVDISSAMLSVAKTKAGVRGRVTQADCMLLPFHGDTFDFAICSFAANHILNIRTMARELARVMKSGADLLLTDVHADAYAQGWRTGFRDKYSAIQIETRPRTAEEMSRAFHAAGFECLKHVPLCLGVPEKPIFERAGKQNLFVSACRVPAILFCHFKRRMSLAIR